MNEPIWDFFEQGCKLMQACSVKNRAPLEAASDLIVGRLLRGGRLFSFGCGHSGLVAQDVYYRAGGLMDLRCLFVPEVALDLEPPEASSEGERRDDWVARLEPAGGFQGNDALVLISTSGVNVGPVELARRVKEADAGLVAITSLALSSSLPPRHASGQRLCDHADVVLDNLITAGDALVDMGDGMRMGSMSTALGSILIQALMIGVRERAAAQGLVLPVYVSGNAPGGMEENRRRKEQRGGA